MKVPHYPAPHWLVGLVCLMTSLLAHAGSEPTDHDMNYRLDTIVEQPTVRSDSNSTADHAKFEELKGPFNNGPEVTKACLKCHTEAGHQFMKNVHWTW